MTTTRLSATPDHMSKIKIFTRTQPQQNHNRTTRQRLSASIAKLIHDEGRSTMRKNARKRHRNLLKGRVKELAKVVMRRNDALWGAS